MLLFIHFWFPLSGGVVSFFCGVVLHYLHLAVEKRTGSCNAYGLASKIYLNPHTHGGPEFCLF